MGYVLMPVFLTPTLASDNKNPPQGSFNNHAAAVSRHQTRRVEADDSNTNTLPIRPTCSEYKRV